VVTCPSCGSANLEKFESEVTIHSPRIKDIDNRPVLVFGEVSVCLSCGKADFVVPQPQLARLSTRSETVSKPVKKPQ
jgi:hypothetical protein